MATETQTQVLRRNLQPARTHDYIYDTVWTLSSNRDHSKAAAKAVAKGGQLQKLPIYKSMFSELRQHPRFEIRLSTKDPVPSSMNKDFRGSGGDAGGMTWRQGVEGSSAVGGSNRPMYFRRPVLPYNQYLPPNVMLDSARMEGAAATSAEEVTVTHRTIGIQTMYRDSDVQTDPFTPEYVVRPGSAPEVLTLATLSFGRGLPAGLAEVEMIERAREKRAWEAELPDLHDIENRDKRTRMMDEMERREWLLREEEIEKLQEMRMELLNKMLEQREQNVQELTQKRLDILWNEKQRKTLKSKDKIHSKHIEALRKLLRKRKNALGEYERRDVIKDYANPGAQPFAPLARVGMFPDRNADRFGVRSKYIDTYDGLLELERSMPNSLLNPKIKAPRRVSATVGTYVKRAFKEEHMLGDVYSLLKDKKKEKTDDKQPRFLEKIEKAPPRPETPTRESPGRDEETELAVIHLQQLIRGRAVQNMMFEGKQRRRDLIAEVRGTHALQDHERAIMKDEEAAHIQMQRRLQLQHQRDDHVAGLISELSAENVVEMLDFLNGEVVRLHEERRIHAFSMLAERRRRIREAEEAGLRQVEERRRREEDEIFKQTIKMHQETVDSYLEDIVVRSVSAVAAQDARQFVRQLADEVNDMAYEMEEKKDALQSEEIVAELVHCFLLPEVAKRSQRDQVHAKQRQFLLAAHREIYDAQSNAAERLPQAASPAAAPSSRPASTSPKVAPESPSDNMDTYRSTMSQEYGNLS